MKLLIKCIYLCWCKIQLKFCRQTCWKEQPFIFTVYLMNHPFQTTILFNMCQWIINMWVSGGQKCKFFGKFCVGAKYINLINTGDIDFFFFAERPSYRTMEHYARDYYTTFQVDSKDCRYGNLLVGCRSWFLVQDSQRRRSRLCFCFSLVRTCFPPTSWTKGLGRREWKGEWYSKLYLEMEDMPPMWIFREQ